MKNVFESIKTKVEAAEVDLEKFLNGTMAAGARVRKSMQELKKLAQELRIKVQDVKNSAKSKKVVSKKKAPVKKTAPVKKAVTKGKK